MRHTASMSGSPFQKSACTIQAVKWEELRHPFLFESLIKPLRLGVPVFEIPGIWKARTEGESQNTFARNFSYVTVGLRTRFAARRKTLRI
jgi:hypothetical protein